MSTIQVLPGVAGIKEAYTQALKAQTIDVICLSQRYEEVIGAFFSQVVEPALATKQVREITQDPTGRSTASESDVMITPDAAYLISFTAKEPQAVIIHDQALRASLQLQFEALWQVKQALRSRIQPSID